MAMDPKTKIPKRRKSKTLNKVLKQSARAKDLVEKAAEELTSVNVVLKHELSDLDAQPEIGNAIQKSESAEEKVQDAAEELSVVQHALENEVKERHGLEIQLANAENQEEIARHASLHDQLTGLPNRELFYDRLEHGLAQANRHKWTLAVMFMDLNGFKSINDTYGHSVGDLVLQTISQRLKENTRTDDTVSRQGGDEFLYLLMEVRSEVEITRIAENILKIIEEPCHVDEKELRVSASMGISIFPKNGSVAETLVQKADKAMYLAKQNKQGYSFAA